MKKISLMLMAFGLVAASCTKSEFDNVYGEDPHADFARQFTQTFGNIDPNQDWGFGTATIGNRAAYAVSNHKDADWMKFLEFELPESYNEITTGSTQLTGSVCYVPAGFEGAIDFNNFNGDLYVAGKITSCSGNPGTVKLYIIEDGYWGCGVSAGTITIYNRGNLELPPYAVNNQNIKTIYNGGSFKVEGDADFASGVSIYSTGDATFEIVAKSTKYESTSDIHGTIHVTGYFDIQTPSTNKYICGIVSDDNNDILIDSDITTSYIEARNIELRSDNIFLTNGGYIKANQVYFNGNGKTATGSEYEAIKLLDATSKALVEVNEFYCKQDNLGKHLSTGVYAKFNTISYNKGGQMQNNIASSAYSDEDLSADYINNNTVSGVSDCGGKWGSEGTLRIIAEDLGGAISDFDYNDVVFDAYIEDGKAHITLQAAGGTLPLYVAGKEVHEAFGVDKNVMVNTKAEGGVEKAPVTYVVDVDYTSVKEIPVVVYGENGKQLTLKAEPGKAAEKIAVGTDYDWTEEREPVYIKYDRFEQYVKDASLNHWYKD